jgi:hypothetical protein
VNLAGLDVVLASEEITMEEDFDEPRIRKGPSREPLEAYWIGIIWGSLLMPCVGGWVIVLLSSVMYYVWLKDYPVKAKSINLHGWLAWLTGQALGLILYLALTLLLPAAFK